jgi:type IV pilus assembly protein PilW
MKAKKFCKNAVTVAVRPWAALGGFTLIELMVGLAIGLLLSLGILKIYTVWDARQRLAGAQSDAQISAALAAYALEQDLRAAGRGFGSVGAKVLGCSIAAPVPSGVASFGLYPVKIEVNSVDAAAPDVITVFYGTSPYRVVGDAVLAAKAGSAVLRNRGGFMRGDMALLTTKPPSGGGGPAPLCKLIEITDKPGDNSNQEIKHEASGEYDTDYKKQDGSGFIKVTPIVSTSGALSDFEGGLIYDLGAWPKLHKWEVTTSSVQAALFLQKTNLLPRPSNPPGPGTVQAVADNIVNLKAQYGHDANENKTIEEDEWTADPASVASWEWSRVLAVRFAVLARSAHYEADPNYHAPQPSWSGGNFTMKDLDGSSPSTDDSPNDWRKYRYQVLERTVSLRNFLEFWK